MKTKNKYILLKKSIYKKIVSWDFDDSFEISKKKDMERIGVIKFYDDKIINKVIKKSIDNRFKKILELIASLEESSDNPSNGLIFCLDETAKFKREMINKYNKFLKKTQIDFINKKIELIEKEIKNKLITYRLINMSNIKKSIQSEEIEETRHRSR